MPPLTESPTGGRLFYVFSLGGSSIYGTVCPTVLQVAYRYMYLLLSFVVPCNEKYSQQGVERLA